MSGGSQHHPAAKVDEIRAMLLDRQLNCREIAEACGVSDNSVYWQRGVLQDMGLLPERVTAKRRVITGASSFVEGRYIPKQLCLCDGCHDTATQGKFCDAHATRTMVARATAGMSEATRRKLTGARA